MNRIFFGLAALTLVIPVATVTRAQELGSVHIKVSDLNFGSPEGIRTARNRVAVAINQLCGMDERRYIISLSERDPCRAEALASVEPQIQRSIALAQQENLRLAAR